MNPRRLYRSRTDRQIAGVAGGMAEYLGLDPTVVRILWILSVFLGGFTLLLYLIMVFIVPLAPAGAWTPAPGTTGGWAPAGAPDATGTSEGTEAGQTSQPGLTGQPGPDGTPGGYGAPAAFGPPAGYVWTPASPAPTRDGSRGAGAAIYLGVLLVVFGAFALVDSILPGWAGHGSAGPAVLVALGAMLLVGAMRRTTES